MNFQNLSVDLRLLKLSIYYSRTTISRTTQNYNKQNNYNNLYLHICSPFLYKQKSKKEKYYSVSRRQNKFCMKYMYVILIVMGKKIRKKYIHI